MICPICTYFVGPFSDFRSINLTWLTLSCHDQQCIAFYGAEVLEHDFALRLNIVGLSLSWRVQKKTWIFSPISFSSYWLLLLLLFSKVKLWDLQTWQVRSQSPDFDSIPFWINFRISLAIDTTTLTVWDSYGAASCARPLERINKLEKLRVCYAWWIIAATFELHLVEVCHFVVLLFFVQSFATARECSSLKFRHRWMPMPSTQHRVSTLFHINVDCRSHFLRASHACHLVDWDLSEWKRNSISFLHDGTTMTRPREALRGEQMWRNFSLVKNI